MAQYLLRKVNTIYSLAKFDDSDSPLEVYKITSRGCNCPASRRGCKHTKILAKWKLDKELPGLVYNDEAVKIGYLNLTE